MKLSIKFIIFIGVLALGAGLWTAYRNINTAPELPKDIQATIFPIARPVPEFSLIDHNNRPFTPENFKDHWTFLFFGFTSCPEICPTTLAALKEIYTQLSPHTEKDPVQVVLVTVDPEEDTLARLKEYLAQFNPAFIGVTGPESQLNNLREQLGIIAEKSAMIYHPKDPEAAPIVVNTIDHTGAILLVSPDGTYYGLFSMPHHAQQIAQDFIKVRDYHQKAHPFETKT